MTTFRSGALAGSLLPMLQHQVDAMTSAGSTAHSNVDFSLRQQFGNSDAFDDENQPPVNDGPVLSRSQRFKVEINKFAAMCNESIWLERMSVLIVFVNCITLTFHRPCAERVSCDFLCITWRVVDKIALCFFVFEMGVKIIHIGPRKYLEDRWHYLDILIVLFGLMEEALLHFQINLASIRAMRILRPLRTIEWIPSVRLLVSLLWDTLPMLANVFLLSLFFFIVFGIMAVQLWAGVLRQRCYHSLNLTAFPTDFPGVDMIERTPFYKQHIGDFLCSLENGVHQCSGVPSSRSPKNGKLCKLSVEDAIAQWNFQLEEALNATLMAAAELVITQTNFTGDDTTITYDSNWTSTALSSTTSFSSLLSTTPLPPPVLSDCINWNRVYNECRGTKDTPNPFEGAISFDNVLMAWVAIFQVVTLEGWSDIMYHVQDTHSFWAFLYFVPLILFGSYFLVNLCLACITIQLARSQYMYYTQAHSHNSARRGGGKAGRSSGPNQGRQQKIAGLCESAEKQLEKLFHFLGERICRLIRSKKPKVAELHSESSVGGSVTRALLRAPTVESFIADTSRRPYRGVRSFSFVALNEWSFSLAHAQQRCFFSGSSHSFDTAVMMARMRDPSVGSFLSVSLISNGQTQMTPAIAPDNVSLFSNSEAFTEAESSVAGTANDSPMPARSPLISTEKIDQEIADDRINAANEEEPNQVNVIVHHCAFESPNPGHNARRSLLIRQDAIYSKRTSAGTFGGKNEPTVVRQQTTRTSSSSGGDFIEPVASQNYQADNERLIEGGSPVETAGNMPTTATPTTPTTPTTGRHSTSWLKRNRCVAVLCAPVANFFAGIRNWLIKLLRHPVADYFFMYCIFISTFILAVEHHDQPRVLSIIVHSVNILFTLVFAIEFIMKIICFGPSYYTKSVFNALDAFIVLFTIADLFGGTMLAVFRAIRLVRLFKLMDFVPSLRNTLASLFRVVDSAITFLVFLCICMYVFALFGTFLLGGRLCETEFGDPCICGQPPPGATKCICNRKNFDSFLASMLSVFQIFTQESWNELLYESMSKVSPWIAIYYVMLVMIGNFILLNLLIAILVSGFLERAMEQDPKKSSLVAISRHGTATRQPSNVTVSNIFALPHLNFHLSPNSYPRIRSRLQSRSKTLEPISETTIRRSTSWPKLAQAEPPIENRTHCSLREQTAVSCASLGAIGLEKPSNHDGSVSSDDASENFVSALDVNYSDVAPRLSSSLSSSFSASSSSASDEQLATPMTRRSAHSALTPKVSNTQVENAAKYDEEMLQETRETIEDLVLVQKMVDEKKPVGTITLCRRLLAIISKHMRGEFRYRSEWAFYCLAPDNCCRRAIKRFVEHRFFLMGVFALIAVNCIAVAIENPNIDPESNLRSILDYANNIMAVLFTIEMILKMIAYGVLFNADAYLRNNWNVLDCILAIVCVIEIGLSSVLRGKNTQLISVLRVLRMLRALRPLRIINSSRNLRLIVETIFSSLAEIGTVVVICFFFFLVYAIFGVQTFHGCLGRCRGANLTNIKTRIECVLAGNRWQNDFYNFDNVVVALQTLFVFATFDNWMAIMFAGVDCVGIDKQPQENANPWRMAYFLSFIIFCGFFLLNIFVGVVVSNFQRNFDNMKARDAAAAHALAALMLINGQNIDHEPSASRTSFSHMNSSFSSRRLTSQRSNPWLSSGGAGAGANHIQRDPLLKLPSNEGGGIANNLRKFRVFSGFRHWKDRFRFVCTHTYFDLLSCMAILLNVIMMSVEHYGMSEELSYSILIGSYVFTVLFTLEMLVRLCALGCRLYFTEPWNVFDFFIVVSSLASTIFEEMSRHELPLNATLVRVMRIAKFARVLKVLRVANTMHRIIDTVGKSLLQVGHLCLLIILVFFIYAALGVELFGRLNYSAIHLDRDCLPGQYKCHVLGEHANFANMGMAMLTLFRMLTGDNWSGLMKDIVQLPCDPAPDCVPAPILSRHHEHDPNAPHSEWPAISSAPIAPDPQVRVFGENGEPLYCCVPWIFPTTYFISFVLITTLCLLNLVVAVIMGTLEDSYDYQPRSSRSSSINSKQAAIMMKNKAKVAALVATKTNNKQLSRTKPKTNNNDIDNDDNTNQKL